MALTIVKPEDLKNYIGKDLGTTEWFKVDQERINKFADATEDHQFIHVDSKKLLLFLVQRLRMAFFRSHLLPVWVETLRWWLRVQKWV